MSRPMPVRASCSGAPLRRGRRCVAFHLARPPLDTARNALPGCSPSPRPGFGSCCSAAALRGTWQAGLALAGLVQTVFRGTTLRSMLLEAYGFWQMGQIALFAAIASFIGAGL